MRHAFLCMALASAIATNAEGGDDWVTVKPKEFEGAINNPLKGFRSYHSDGYGLTGPPPKNYDFKTRVIGGSRSPHGSA